MAEKNVEKEIEEIKARLIKIEQHVGLCIEHEGTEGHGQEHEGTEGHGQEHEGTKHEPGRKP